jgi:hypothetical protein
MASPFCAGHADVTVRCIHEEAQAPPEAVEAADCEMLRMPHCLGLGSQTVVRFVSPTHRPRSAPQGHYFFFFFCYSFLLEAE